MAPRRARPRITAVVAAALLCGGAAPLAGCSAQQAGAGQRVGDVSEQGYVSGDGTTTILPVSQRRPAPALSGATLSGGTFTLSEAAGDVVVLNVWASWCAPCRAEAPDLQKVAAELADRGVTFVGLNTRDSKAAAQAFVDRFGLSYDSVVDADGSLQLLFRETLPPAAIPSTVVIDPQGRVAARAIGEVDRSRLLGLVEPVLAESASPGAS
jgi:thiol-disulfide isomerase/thioredoxin